MLQSLLIFSFLKPHLVAPLGFEPKYSDSESDVLPVGRQGSINIRTPHFG